MPIRCTSSPPSQADTPRIATPTTCSAKAPALLFRDGRRERPSQALPISAVAAALHRPWIAPIRLARVPEGIPVQYDQPGMGPN